MHAVVVIVWAVRTVPRSCVCAVRLYLVLSGIVAVTSFGVQRKVLAVFKTLSDKAASALAKAANPNPMGSFRSVCVRIWRV